MTYATRTSRGWKPRGYGDVRERLGHRIGRSQRYIQSPAVPTGIKRKRAIQRTIFPRPSVSRREQDVKRYMKFKQDLVRRYDTDETNRRKDLTPTQHLSRTGKIGSEGFRRYTVITGIPHRRDRSPHWLYDGKKRQYAYQNEFDQSKRDRDSARQDVFRNKRDDGTKPLFAYKFRKKQPVYSRVVQT